MGLLDRLPAWVKIATTQGLQRFVMSQDVSLRRGAGLPAIEAQALYNLECEARAIIGYIKSPTEYRGYIPPFYQRLLILERRFLMHHDKPRFRTRYAKTLHRMEQKGVIAASSRLTHDMRFDFIAAHLHHDRLTAGQVRGFLDEAAQMVLAADYDKAIEKAMELVTRDSIADALREIYCEDGYDPACPGDYQITHEAF